MTSYVLTIIGNADSAPLEPFCIKNITRNLEGIVSTPIKIDWLAEYEACDFYLQTDLSAPEITKLCRAVSPSMPIDIVCLPALGRRKKLLISDMDSTVINQECIDELGNMVGIGEQIREITTMVVNGEITFPDALRKRVALMKGMKQEVLDRVYRDRISLMPGGRTLVQTMRHHGAYCILVSGGFTYFTKKISARLGFHDHQANSLVFKDGKLTEEVQDPILGRTAKLTILKTLCKDKELTPFDVIAVGDGANDIEMIEAAGLGVAYHGADRLKECANAWVDYGDLTALLYMQGFRKSDFITS